MLLGLGVLVQIAVDLWIGSRLLRLARLTRGLPELGFGLCLLLFGGLGIPLAAIARTGPFETAAANQGLLVGALGLENLGSFALFFATWRVFRPNAAWARALVWIAGVAFLIATPASGDDGGVFYWLGCAFRGLPFLWSAIESARYGAMLRRRRALGLAEPIVIERMALWALSCSACAFGFVVFIGARLLGVEPNAAPVMLAQSSVALLSGGALWIGFAPPDWYRARFRAPDANASAA